MKNMLFLGLLLISTSVVADESKWYIGSGIGQADPKLELDEEVADSTIDVGGETYEVPVSVDSEFKTYGQKLFVGYDVGDEKGLALELSVVNFGNYRGTLDASIGESGTIDSEYFESVPYSLTLSGDQNISADLYATTFSLLYSFQLSDRISIFPRFGLSYIQGDVYTENVITLTAAIPGRSESISLRETERDRIEVVLPMVGVGADIEINRNHFIRTEFERYGHPTKQYVDMLTVSWGYRFR